MGRARGPVTGLTRLLASLLLAGAAAGQAQASAAGTAQAEAAQEPDRGAGEIVVTGDRDRDRAVRGFVAGITVESDAQIARFPDPVCPASFGLSDAFNAFVAGRVREVARGAGIRVAAQPCRANIVIIAAERGEDVLAALRRRRPALLAGLDASEVRRLTRLEGPVRSWQVVEPRGGDGREMERISFIQLGGGAPIYIGPARHLNTPVASRLERNVRQDLALSVVIFDLDAIDGMTLAQIADHAAMRSLARTDPEAAPSGRTILALFRDMRAGAVPAGALTSLDAAYLRAVYATDNRIGGRQQQANIARAVIREPADAEGAAE